MGVNVNFTPAFVQDDLIVQYNDLVVPQKKISEFSQNYYIMVFNIFGVCKVLVDDKVIDLKVGELFLASKGVQVKINRSTAGKSLCVFFLPNVLKDCESDFLRVFYENKYITYNIAKFERKLCVSAVHSLYNCILENRSRFEFVLRIQAIISELNFIYDKSIHRQPTVKDNLTVTVIEFIEYHYTENITLKTLEDKFFISDKTINRMCKMMRGQTFHNYLISLRLKEAENFMKTNKQKSLKKVAKLSGFQSYSSFFRAYKAKYGKPPAVIKNPKQYYWPLDN